MGWTHRAASHMLNRFPQLGTIPELLEKWPTLKIEVEAKERELGKPLAEALRDGEVVTPLTQDILSRRRE